jgi:hypothetical protein
VRPAILSLAALCALARAQDTAPDRGLVEPPPRAAIAGLAGLATTSEVETPDAQGRSIQAELSVWFVFPERARLQRTPRPSRPGQRELTFRYGPQTWRVEPGHSDSRRLAGEEALAAELELELRRALWLWPDGFAWNTQSAFPFAPVTAPAAKQDEPCFLTARLGADGRPAEMGVARGSPDADARAGAHLRGITWREIEGRLFPATFEVHRGAELAWRERVTATYLAPGALDHFFLPPDLKRGALPLGDSAPRTIRLPERAERRVALSGGEDWAAALAAAQSLADLERERLAGSGLELAPGVLIELDRDARPRALRVELSTLPDALPPDWIRAPQQAAWDQRLARVGPIAADQLARLRAFLGPSERPDWAFVRVAPDGRGALRAVLVQPFEAESL